MTSVQCILVQSKEIVVVGVCSNIVNTSTCLKGHLFIQIELHLVPSIIMNIVILDVSNFMIIKF